MGRVRVTTDAVEKKPVLNTRFCILSVVTRQTALFPASHYLSPVICLALPYFSTLSKKSRDFRGKKVIEYKTCVLISSTTFI
jgi:hypothetical protein